MTTYKITKLSTDKPDKYFENLMQAYGKKEFLKKIKKDGYLYHLFSMPQGSNRWFKLE